MSWCIAPEMTLGIGAGALLLADLLGEGRGRAGLVLFEATVLGALLALALVGGTEAGALGGRFAMDGLAAWMKAIFLMGAAITGAMAEKNGELPTSDNELYLTLLFSTLGACFLASARDIATFYVSLELAGIPMVLLAAWRRDERSSEAGLKYLILGSTASALLLFGLSLIYAQTGSMRFAEISGAIRPEPLLWLAAGLVLAAGAFKVAAAPFHFWAPDVYEGAALPLTAYFSVVGKAVSMLLFFLLLFRALGAVLFPIPVVFASLSALTMTWGNVVAIRQRNLKRLLAYSGISQAGYLLMGFVGAGPESLPAMVFYLLTYLFSNLAAFAALSCVASGRRCEEVRDLRGLALTNPLVALSLALAVFSLAGIPPLSGFTGKLFLFSIASREGMHWLVALAAVNSTVSLYYYLGLVRAMYIEKPERAEHEAPVSASFVLRGALAVNVGAVITLGVLPVFYSSIRTMVH